MATKKNIKLKKEKKVFKDSKQNADKFINNESPENPLDFGGLPPRDLKKNMGCG